MKKPDSKTWVIEFEEEYNSNYIKKNNNKVSGFEYKFLPYRFYFVRKFGWKIKGHSLRLSGKIRCTIKELTITIAKPIKKVSLANWIMIIIGVISIFIAIKSKK